MKLLQKKKQHIKKINKSKKAVDKLETAFFCTLGKYILMKNRLSFVL